MFHFFSVIRMQNRSISLSIFHFEFQLFLKAMERDGKRIDECMKKEKSFPECVTPIIQMIGDIKNG